MPRPFFAEEQIEVGGETFRLVINFEAIDATETLLGGMDYLSILATIQRAGENPPLGLVGKVVWGLMRAHHPNITLDQIASLLFGEAGMQLGYAVEKLMLAAFPTSDETPKEKPANPRKPRGASKTS